MTVLPESTEETKAPKPITIEVPNEKGSRGLAPPASVTSLGDQLRVGEKLRVTYQKSGMCLKYKAASVDGGLSAEESPDEFTYVRPHRVRLGRKYYTGIIAGRGSLQWQFVVPDEAIAGAGVGEPAPDLLKKIQGLQRGGKVRLTYDPHKFFFWLKDVEPVAQDEATAKAG